MSEALPQHNNDIGDWCPYSGVSVKPGTGCPQWCAAAPPDDEEKDA